MMMMMVVMMMVVVAMVVMEIPLSVCFRYFVSSIVKVLWLLGPCDNYVAIIGGHSLYSFFPIMDGPY